MGNLRQSLLTAAAEDGHTTNHSSMLLFKHFHNITALKVAVIRLMKFMKLVFIIYKTVTI